MDRHVESTTLVFTRHVKVPASELWQAWTNCDVVSRWWGPNGWAPLTCEIDLRETARFLVGLRAPAEQGGTEEYLAGTYEYVDVPRRLIFTVTRADRKGNSEEPHNIGQAEALEHVARINIELVPDGEMTRMTVIEEGWDAGEPTQLFLSHMNDALDRLEACVLGVDESLQVTSAGEFGPPKVMAKPGELTAAATFHYQAPPERVYRAFTDPGLIARWMGTRERTMEVEEFHLVKGGVYRYAQHAPNGQVFRTRGVFHEIVPGRRIVTTYEIEGDVEPAPTMLETLTFERGPGDLTRVTRTLAFPSTRARDAHLAFMERDTRESFMRLAELLGELDAEEVEPRQDRAA